MKKSAIYYDDVDNDRFDFFCSQGQDEGLPAMARTREYFYHRLINNIKY